MKVYGQMKRALLLNADYSPLHFISDVRAVVLLLKGRAEVIPGHSGALSLWDEFFVSPGPVLGGEPRRTFVPATLRLFRRVNKKWKPPKFRKKVLFNRDAWRCQYCSEELVWDSVTIDHILPISRGGKTSWSNCVTACRTCNKTKADMTPAEAGMKLRSVPGTPTSLHFWDVMRSNASHPDWEPYLRC